MGLGFGFGAIKLLLLPLPLPLMPLPMMPLGRPMMPMRLPLPPLLPLGRPMMPPRLPRRTAPAPRLSALALGNSLARALVPRAIGPGLAGGIAAAGGAGLAEVSGLL